MRSLPVLVAALVSVFVSGLVAAVPVSDAAADPVRTIWHLQPVDGSTATAAPTVPPAAPLLGDVAGPAREVTLPEILALAVRTMPDLAQARLDRAIAADAVARAETWGDWAVGGSVAATAGRTATIDSSVTVGVSADIGRRLSTGGTLAFQALAGFGRTAAGDTTTTGFTEEVSASYTQPLMQGRGEAFVRANERVARLQLTAVELQEQQTARDAVRDVVLAYLDLVDAENSLAIQRSSLDLARERLRVTEAGIRAGGVAESETISVEQAIATREEGAMSSELQVIDRSLTLRRMIGMEMGPGEIVLSSRIDLAVPARQWDNAALIEQALAQSPEFAAFDALDASAAIDVEVNEQGVLPNLDLVFTLGASGTDSNPASAAVELVKLQELSATGALNYRTAWGQRGARASLRSARLNRETVRVTRDDVRRQFIEGMSRAVAQVQAAERRFGIAARATKLAEKNLAVEQARLGLGRSRNVDVLIRQDELRAAQLRASQAVLDWHRAATAIAALTGELLPTYGVTLGDR